MTFGTSEQRMSLAEALPEVRCNKFPLNITALKTQNTIHNLEHSMVLNTMFLPMEALHASLIPKIWNITPKKGIKLDHLR